MDQRDFDRMTILARGLAWSIYNGTRDKCEMPILFNGTNAKAAHEIIRIASWHEIDLAQDLLIVCARSLAVNVVDLLRPGHACVINQFCKTAKLAEEVLELTEKPEWKPDPANPLQSPSQPAAQASTLPESRIYVSELTAGWTDNPRRFHVVNAKNGLEAMFAVNNQLSLWAGKQAGEKQQYKITQVDEERMKGESGSLVTVHFMPTTNTDVPAHDVMVMQARHLRELYKAESRGVEKGRQEGRAECRKILSANLEEMQTIQDRPLCFIAGRSEEYVCWTKFRGNPIEAIDKLPLQDDSSQQRAAQPRP